MPADEDEVVFREGAVLRVLRGVIVSEDERFVHVNRNDGSWSIAKFEIVKMRRARRGVR